MENKARVLGYSTSKEITDEELKNIAGGSVKWTCQNTLKGTGSMPGNGDGIADQVWD